MKVHGLRVVCTGSVWKSWDLFKVSRADDRCAASWSADCVPRRAGRMRGTAEVHLRASAHTLTATGSRLELVQLTETAAVGAAALAARDIQAPLALDYASFSKPFFSKS